jgi:hypothetical protein
MNLQLGTDDFESVLETVLMAGKRQVDGGLPQIGFMRPRAGGDQVDKGLDVGLPFSGAAPDLGAFEWIDTTAVSKDVVHDNSYRSVITSDVAPFFVKVEGLGIQLYLSGFEAAHSLKTRLYDVQGRLCQTLQLKPTDHLLKITSLPAGYYLLRLDVDGRAYTGMVSWW